MYGLFYNTEIRDEKTGESFFYITPKEKNNYPSHNGLIRCMGVIGLYQKGTPIMFEDSYLESKKCVEATDIKIATGTKEKNKTLLEFITNELSEYQKDILSSSVSNIFDLVNHKEILENALHKKKDGKEQLIKTLLNKLQSLEDSENMFEILSSYSIATDKIYYLQKKGISLEQINKKPYDFLLKADIPINQIDEYAVNEIKVQAYDLQRLNAFVFYTMRTILNNGSTCISFEKLLILVNQYFDKYGMYPNTKINSFLLNLCVVKQSCLMYQNLDGKLYVYFKHVYEEEQKIIRHISRLKKSKKKTNIQINTKEIEDLLNVRYAKEQKYAFSLLKTTGIKILTGPPGSGKTSIIKGLIKTIEKSKKEVKVAATTGVAARIAGKAAELSATTVHILLDIQPYNSQIASKDLNNPIDADLIIIDEVSMIGLALFSFLIAAIKNDSILLLVGGEDQLQSVEYGNVLHDLIASNVIEVYRLPQTFRQVGTIPQNAYKIKIHQKRLEFDNYFQLLNFESNEQAFYFLRSQIYDDSLYLCHIKKGIISTQSINEVFQKQNKNAILFCYGHTKYKKGDKIIFTKTNYEIGYVNGDIGIIVDYKEDILLIQLSEKILEISIDNFSDISLAYSITIHKSQGSESNVVYIFLPDGIPFMLSTRLIYTAITRAKKKVIICSVKNAFYDAIENKGEYQRITKLAYLLEKSEN